MSTKELHSAPERIPGSEEEQAAHRFLAEPDAPPIRSIFIQLLVLSLVLIGSLIGLIQLYKMATAREIYAKELALPNKELLELRAHEEGLLAQYTLVDKQKDIYRIPLIRALELLLTHPDRLTRPFPPATAPSSQSTTPQANGVAQ